ASDADRGGVLVEACMQLACGAGAAGGGAVFDLNGASGVFTGSGLLLLTAMIIVFAGVRVRSPASEE
ncbi:MFS transporter, partial [Raoultella planticola]|nr:MFS transporter [Raoultella planticola]